MDTRRFSECDRSALRRIYLQSRMHSFEWLDSSSFTDSDFDRDTEGETIWVAADGNNPVGFVSVWESENFIHNLFVHPDVFGQGVGSCLLNECLKHIGRPAVLKCVTQNTKAKDIYLSKGWQVVSEEEGPDGNYQLMHFDDET